METIFKRLSFIIAIAMLAGLNHHPDLVAADQGATIDIYSGKPCFKCHKNKLTAEFVHSALAENSCVPCHKITNGNHQANHWLAKVKDRSSILCYECHENRSGLKSVHQPIRENDCLVCHAPHAADNKYLLRFQLDKLCFECHQRNLVSAKETREATAFRDGMQNLHHIHAGKNKIPCLTCHEPHASVQLHLLRLKGTNGGKTAVITYTATSTGGNCTTSCHDAADYNRK